MQITYIRLKPKKNIPISSDIILKMLSVTIPSLLIATEAFAAPSTGLSKLDAGGWKIVDVLQSVIFWLAMAYTLRSLLEVTVKGEGSWKKVGQGFIICAMDYLIPWGFEIIRDSFR